MKDSPEDPGGLGAKVEVMTTASMEAVTRTGGGNASTEGGKRSGNAVEIGGKEIVTATVTVTVTAIDHRGESVTATVTEEIVRSGIVTRIAIVKKTEIGTGIRSVQVEKRAKDQERKEGKINGTDNQGEIHPARRARRKVSCQSPQRREADDHVERIRSRETSNLQLNRRRKDKEALHPHE